MATKEKRIYVGDVGTEIRVETGIDLTDATTLELEVKKPGETEAVTWTGTAMQRTDGLLSIIKYITQADDISIKGTWQLIAFAEWADGTQFHGGPARFPVYGLYEP